MNILGPLVGSLWAFVQPNLWWIAPLVLALFALGFPMLGRGPSSSRPEVWRRFRRDARVQVFERAGGRCEEAAFFLWLRCRRTASEVDHVFPYSRGGPTTVGNAQALCASHNRSKGSRMPAWWYVLALEKRRRTYFPEGANVRVSAVMTAGDVEARRRWEAKRGR